MRDFGECAEISNDPVKVFQERKSKITFHNNKRKRINKVDVECLKLKGKSCDGLLLELENNNIEHFIELKGNKVLYAVKQIQNSIILISSDPKRQVKYSYIASTKSPSFDSNISKIKRLFKKEYNSSFTINTRHLTVNI